MARLDQEIKFYVSIHRMQSKYKQLKKSLESIDTERSTNLHFYAFLPDLLPCSCFITLRYQIVNALSLTFLKKFQSHNVFSANLGKVLEIFNFTAR